MHPTSDLALSIEGLKKSYDGKTVVDDLHLKVAPGEIFGLLGPNGAGKSTTINAIGGVVRPDSGSIKIFGFDAQKDALTTRRLTGVMHQEVVFDPFFTLERGLQIHAGYYGEKDDPKWRAELLDRLALRPHAHKKMPKLSGGMKRRYMVAKALIHKPKLLILDEPTAGVDIELRKTLWDFVREINEQGTTVLLTTHYLEEAESMCNRIAIMDHGKLAALDHTDKLLKQVDTQELQIRVPDIDVDLAALLNQRLIARDRSTQTLRFSLPLSTSVAEFIFEIQQSKLEILDLELKKPKLEDVFLKLTGGPSA